MFAPVSISTLINYLLYAFSIEHHKVEQNSQVPKFDVTQSECRAQGGYYADYSSPPQCLVAGDLPFQRQFEPMVHIYAFIIAIYENLLLFMASYSLIFSYVRLYMIKQVVKKQKSKVRPPSVPTMTML